MPLIGWMNDPNVISYYNGEYHLFYQYNPYSSMGSIHRAHVKSKRFINWEYFRYSYIVPDEAYI
ncbi:MAG: hypothetical protein U0Z74_01805 [Romboutsia timonensis]